MIICVVKLKIHTKKVLIPFPRCSESSKKWKFEENKVKKAGFVLLLFFLIWAGVWYLLSWNFLQFLWLQTSKYNIKHIRRKFFYKISTLVWDERKISQRTIYSHTYVSYCEMDSELNYSKGDCSFLLSSWPKSH